MSRLTTLKIGGPARFFAVSKTQEDLTVLIKKAVAEKIAFLVIGEGSNLLISDKGFNGLVIKNEASGIGFEKNLITVKSGTLLQDLVDFTIKNGFSGVHKLTGIPGTVGGAVFGNAGAYGQTISDHISKVLCFSPETENLVLLTKNKCYFSYRESLFKKTHLVILKVVFIFPKENPKALKKVSAEVLSQRLKKYPPGLLCPGSFFKNIIASDLPVSIVQKIPKEKIVYGKIPAGYLLEDVGAKGGILGDVCVSPRHGNLFINKGRGTAKDFYKLVKKYQVLVKKRFGIILKPEVKLVNLPPISP